MKQLSKQLSVLNSAVIVSTGSMKLEEWNIKDWKE